MNLNSLLHFVIVLSGQVGINPLTSSLTNNTFEAEVQQVMENFKTEVKKHKLTMDDIVSTTIYLKDIKQYERLNKVYGSYFSKQFPTRTCIVVADLPVGASVEISGIAQFQSKK